MDGKEKEKGKVTQQEHIKDEIEHLNVCPDCRSDLARHTARGIAEKFRGLIEDAFRGIGIEDKKGFFQAEVCQLVSAFILSHSIKILQNNKLDEAVIRHMCGVSTEMSFEFAEKGRFTVIREH